MSFFADKVVSEGLTFGNSLITIYCSEVLPYEPEFSFRSFHKISCNHLLC
jgi:hypothetical protein